MLLRFAAVGATGVLVNLLVVIACTRLGPDAFDVAIDLPLTDFNVRYYHVYATVAFLVANLWNFQLNRTWTFRSAAHAGWRSEYLPFLAVGLVSLLANLGILTLLLHPHSPVALSSEVFDDSSGLRSRVYWAQLIAVCLVTPLSFVVNKLWTFSAVRWKVTGRDATPAP
jgi:putative flippase GtrA